jgi:hypothetical protein
MQADPNTLIKLKKKYHNVDRDLYIFLYVSNVNDM